MTTATQAKSFAITLTANDLERSMHFYTQGLGFVVVDREEVDGKLQGVMLEAGEAKLGLSQDDFAKGRDRVKGVGLGLYIETDQDLDALAQRAKDAGIALDGEPGKLPWGALGFRVTDPDGFKLTIAQPS